MVQILLVVLGVVLLVLAGANVRAPRFNPEWYGIACLAAAYFTPLLVGAG